MQIGSIVQCVWDTNYKYPEKFSSLPKRGNPYIVRNLRIHPSGKLGVSLEEITAEVDLENGEWQFKAERFKELLPPLDIQEALDSSIPVLVER